MHHALRSASGAGSEREIDDSVGIVVGRKAWVQSCIRGRIRLRPRIAAAAAGHGVHRFHERQRLSGRDDVGLVGVRPIAGLHDDNDRAAAFEELHDFGDGVVLVQRRAADIAVAGAREQRYDALDAGRQPDRHALAAANAVKVQALGDRVDPGQKLAPGEPHARVAQRVVARPLGRMTRQQRVERIAPPHPLLVVALCVAR